MKRNIAISAGAVTIVAVLAAVLFYSSASAYPRSAGIDPETGLRLVQIQFCSDVCPEYTRVFTVFEGVDSPDECLEIGGQAIRDAAWHGFIGCQPKANETDPPEIFG